MLISQYVSCSNFKDLNERLVGRLIWLAAKLAFRAVKRKHGGMLLMVSRRKIKSNYEKIRNNRLDHKAGRFVFNPDVEELILKHGVEDGAILIDRKGTLIDNNCALPLDFKKRYNGEGLHGGVRRATAINVTKRFKALALMIRSNGSIVIVHRGKITGIIKYAETPYGDIVPLVEKLHLSNFPETESFYPQLKNKVRFVSMEKLIKSMERPYVAKLDYFQDNNRQYTFENTPHPDQRIPPVNWNLQNLGYIYGNGISPTAARQVYDMMWRNANIDHSENRNYPQLPMRTMCKGKPMPRPSNDQRNNTQTTAVNPHMAAIINGIYAIMNRTNREKEHY